MTVRKTDVVVGRKLTGGLACLLMIVSPQHSFAIDPEPPTVSAEPAEQSAAIAPAPVVEDKFTRAELEKLSLIHI